MEFKESIEQPSTNETALIKIQGISEQIFRRGANDYEGPAIEKIKERLAEGGYENPDDAVREVEIILDRKQDYH